MEQKLEFTEKQLNAWKKEYAANATDEQFDLWIEDCKMRGLIPVRDSVIQIRTVNEYDPEVRSKVLKKRAIYITTIGALLKLAERTGKYAGQLPATWIYLDSDGNPSIESTVPLPEPGSTSVAREPWAAKVPVLRKDFTHPIEFPARFNAYAQTYSKDNKTFLNSTWSARGVEQLSKCALAAALRLAFPEELSGIYVAEEVEKQLADEVEEKNKTAEQTVVAAPAPVVAPAVDHTPAEGKDAPRPGEEKPKRGSRKKNEQATPPVPETSTNVAEVSTPAATEEAAAPVDNDPPATSEERNGAAAVLRDVINNKGVDKEKLKAWILNLTGKQSTSEISKKGWDLIVDKLQAAGDKAAEMIGG